MADKKLVEIKNTLKTYSSDLAGVTPHLLVDCFYYFNKNDQTPVTLEQFGVNNYFKNSQEFNDALRTIYQKFNTEWVATKLQVFVRDHQIPVLYLLHEKEFSESDLEFIKKTLKVPSVSTFSTNVLILNY